MELRKEQGAWSIATRPLFALLLVLMLAAGLAGCGGGGGNQGDPAPPPQAASSQVTWEAEELVISATSGVISVARIEFFSDFEITNPEVVLSTELAAFLQASVALSGETGQDGANAVEIVVSPFQSLGVASYQGQLTLETGDDTLIGQVPIRVNIAAPSRLEIPVAPAKPTGDRIEFDSDRNGWFVVDEIFVGLSPTATEHDVLAIARDVGGVLYGGIPQVGYFQIGIPGEAGRLEDVIEQLRADSRLAFAQKNVLLETLATFPNDPLGEIWDEANPDGISAPFEYTRFPSAWDFNQGSRSFLMAIVDTGFDIVHDDLESNIDRIRSSPGRRDFEHGTAVAGVMAAVGNNGLGIPGGMWNANVAVYGVGARPELLGLPVPLLDPVVDSASAIAAFRQAIDAGARVINFSVGSQWNLAGEESAYRHFFETQDARDTLFVISAGNAGGSNAYVPARLGPDFPNVISVTSIDFIDDGTLTPVPFPGGSIGNGVEVAAPGAFVTTLPGNVYGGKFGSSFSAPLVSALAGLLLTEDSSFTPADLEDLILRGARQGDAGNNGIQVAGENFFVINAGRSMELAAARQIGIEQLNNESCSSYGVCAVDLVFGPSVDLSQTYLEIDWGDSSSLSRVSVEACLASGDCQDMGDGRVRVWKAYAAPATYGASIRYARGDGIWRDVGVGFSVSEVNSLSLSANPGDGAATLVWQDLGADRYNLCQANEAVDVFDTCSVYSGGVFALSVGSPPWLVSGLTNGSTYHFRLEALFGNERLISSAASAIPEAGGPGPVAPQALNDTGIELCANASTNWAVCPVAINPGQDGDFGRDALARAGQLDKVGSGAAGFDFTKLDANGNPLPASATSWQCVRDNHTGLIWEVKTADGGLRDRNNTYTWYNPDSSVNGGNAGTQGGGNCVGSACDTRAYSVAVNAQGFCGASDWRVPNIMELRSIIHLGAPRPLSLSSPVIDLSFFPNTIGVRFTQAGAGRYWSSSPWAGSFVWGVDFHHFDGTAAQGSDFGRSRDNPQRVRLVRGGTTDPADLADASCTTTSVPSTTPSGDFEVIAPGIVRHRYTGLEWQRCALGSSWDDAATSCTGTATTRPWSGSLLAADAEAGWRLPNINELNSIVERCNLSPAINGAVFPNTPSIWFWSSSPAPQNGTRWGANFNNGGFVGMGGDSTFGGIRLVRGDSRFAGRWIGVATAGTSAYDYQWDLDQNGTDVTGTILIADQNGPNMALYRMRGTIEGDSMTFEGTSFIEYSNSSTFCMASGSVTLGGAADNIELTGVWGPLAIPGGCPVGSSGGIQLRKVLW